jgi:hypothetical protein
MQTVGALTAGSLLNKEIKSLCDVYLSYDEKPGILSIENTVPDPDLIQSTKEMNEQYQKNK